MPRLLLQGIQYLRSLRGEQKDPAFSVSGRVEAVDQLVSLQAARATINTWGHVGVWA